MDLKLDLKIALKYSLFFSVFVLLLKINDHLSLDEKYFPTVTPFSYVNYFYQIFFAFLIVKAYLEYLKFGNNYKDILVISFFVLFLTDLLNYLIDFSFFKIFYESIHIPHGEGLLGLFDRPFMLMEPQFNFFYGSILFPVQNLFNSLISGDFFGVLNVMHNKLFVLLIVLYLFNLFFLFKKYGQNKWYSIIPILNKLTLLKIAEKPVLWIILVFIPFVRYFFLYSINKKIAKENGFDSKLALGMTFLPSIFYGKVSFNKNPIPVPV
jgi:hypothetical protein